jgi:hypothetical protein
VPITISGAGSLLFTTELLETSGESKMPMISMRQMLDHEVEHDYGDSAFNVNNMEQMHAIMEAAEKTDSPVIVQASAGAR